MSWVADAPSGVYRNHSLSSKIRDAAVAMSVFAPFVDTEPGFGKGKGGTHTITRVHNLPLASQVGETDELPSGRPLIDTISVSPVEWGYKVKLTDFERQLTHFDITNKIQRALRDQLRLTMDKMYADAFKQTPIKVTSTSATAISFDTDGTMSNNPTNNMSVAHIGAMRDYLAGDLKCPPFADGSYILIGTTKALRGIKNDDAYRNWFSPTTAKPIMTGEIPSIENVRIIECNHFDALDNAIGGSGVTGEALMFGADAVFDATVQDPEIRRGIATDLGRFTEVGWVGITQAGLVWDAASQARILHWTAANMT